MHHRGGADHVARLGPTLSDAHLDRPLHDAVSTWLEHDWPFDRVVYAPR
jgi:hypothetical protein